MASDGTKDDLFTLPLHVRRDSVYHRLYDSEDRLVCFIGITDKSELQAEAICSAVNAYSPCREAAVSGLVDALKELMTWMPSRNAPQSKGQAMAAAYAALAAWEASK